MTSFHVSVGNMCAFSLLKTVMYKAVPYSDDSQQTDRVEFSEVVLVREALEDAIGQCRNWLEDATDLSPETNIIPVKLDTFWKGIGSRR